MDGSSFLDILRNARQVAVGESAMVGGNSNDDAAAREFLYEYYWEHAFPHTPTTFALRNDKYKYIYYHGVWDTAELYDLENDPRETQNLVNVPSLKPVVDAMRNRLFDRLTAENAMRVPMRRGDWSASGRLLYE